MAEIGEKRARLVWSDVEAWSSASETAGHASHSSAQSSTATRPAHRSTMSGARCEGGTTPGMFFLNITKAYLGGGAVLLPEAILFGGCILGPAAILVLAFLLNHTMKLLIRMKEAVQELQARALEDEDEPLLVADEAWGRSEDSPHVGLGDIGAFCFGPLGRAAINGALMATNTGIVITYVNLNTQSFEALIFGSSDSSQGQIVLWCQFAVVCILCSLEPQQLSFASLLGNLAVCLTLAVVVVNSVQFIHSADRPPVPPDSKIFAPIGDKAVSAVPNIFFSFVMHGTILSQHEALKPSQRHHAPHQLDLAALVVSLIYAGFSTIAYVAYFGVLNSPSYQAGTSILLVLVPQSSPIVSATTAILSFAILLSIPLFTAGVFDLLGLAWRRSAETASGRDAPGRGNAMIGLVRATVLLMMFAVLSLVRALAPADKSQAGADPLSYPLKITGAVAMSWLGCILPALFYMKLALQGVPTFRMFSCDGSIVMLAGLVGVFACVFGCRSHM